MTTNRQRGGVVFRVVGALVMLAIVVNVISSWVDHQEQEQRAQALAKVKAEAARSKAAAEDQLRADFAKNRPAIVAEMRKAIARKDWDKADELNTRWMAIVNDAEWNSLGAQAARGKEALDSARRVAAEKADRARRKHEGVRIGMTEQQVLESNWGRPESVNRSIYATGVHEQWVYPGYQYLYFDNGILTSIQTH